MEGTHSKAAPGGVLGSGRSLSHVEVTVDISISVDGYAAQGYRTRRSRNRDGVSETATFANGWLTKIIKARLHLQQSGLD